MAKATTPKNTTPAKANRAPNPLATPEAVSDAIIVARTQMLLNQPFFATLAIRLIETDATDLGWCDTLATDGRRLYYNRDFVAKLSKEELIFGIGHEVLHCVYDHMWRRGGRHPKRWNAAADFVINLELEDNGVGKIPDKKTIAICYDKKYKGMCAEEVYELLDGSDYPTFDVHLEPGNGETKNGMPGMTEAEIGELREEIRNAVMQAAKAAGAGRTPAGVKRLLKDLSEPQMDWRELLTLTIKSTQKSDYTWDRCSRKMQASGIYLPSTKDDFKVHVAVAIDCSGSMSDEMLRDLLSETKGIMSQFTDFILELWCFDTTVYNYVKYGPENLSDIDTYEITGGGGTLFECNWEFMKERDICPERFVMMTDGYPGEGWGDEGYCDTLFIVHGDAQKRIVAPFGTTAYYEP